MVLLTHDRWVQLVDGKYVDIDRAHGGQCWDTFADYCISVLGIPPINTWGGTWAGWAYAIWDQYHVNGAAKYFDRIPANQPARAGDVAIWTDQHWYYPASHIAVVLADAGGELYCMSQNSSAPRPWQQGYSPESTGPNIRQKLTKQGLAGYLRRKNFQPAAPPALPKEWDEMATPEEIVDRLTPAIQKVVQAELAHFKPGRTGVRHSGESYSLTMENAANMFREILADPVVLDRIALAVLHRPCYLVDPTGKSFAVTGTTTLAKKINHAARNHAQLLTLVTELLALANPGTAAPVLEPAPELDAAAPAALTADDGAPAVEHG